VISYDLVKEKTGLENDAKIQRAITNLKQRVFSDKGETIFTLSETNTRTPSHLVLCKKEDFQKIQDDFLSSQNVTVQDQSLLREKQAVRIPKELSTPMEARDTPV